MAQRPVCYGTMVPDLDDLVYNLPCRGKAFTVLVTRSGIGVQASDVQVDLSAWEDCQQCPSYAPCYDLCLAKLALRQALTQRLRQRQPHDSEARPVGGVMPPSHGRPRRRARSG
jgi:hypothetical protein